MSIFQPIILEVHGAEALSELAARFTPTEVNTRAVTGLRVGLARVAADAAELAPKDTGILASSIVFDVWGAGIDVWGKVYSPLAYALIMEFGRLPRRGGPPPKGVLLGWMDRHGIPEEAEDSLRWAIFIRGIAPQPFLRPAFEVNIGFIADSINTSLWAGVDTPGSAVTVTLDLGGV